MCIRDSNHKGLWHSLRHTLKGSRARRNWLHANRLRFLGIPTARAVAYIDEWRGPLLWQSYFVMRFVAGTPVSSIFRNEETSDAQKQRIHEQIVSLLHTMAGHGISHAEQTPPNASGRLNGVQLWIALPDAARNMEPSFSGIAETPVFEPRGGLVRVFAGSLGGVRSPAPYFSPLAGADVQVHPTSEAEIELADGTALRLTQETEYPAAGLVRLRIGLDQPRRMNLRLRIPAWSRRTGAAVNGEIHYDDTRRRLTLLPAEPLQSEMRYTLTLKGGKNGAKGLSGYGLQEDYSVDFDTASEHAGPSVVATYPIHEDRGVPPRCAMLLKWP